MTRSLRNVVVVGVPLMLALAGCSESVPMAAGPGPSLVATEPAAPLPNYGLRLTGDDGDSTSVHVFLRKGGAERQVLADRCATAEVDWRRPEGLLLPIRCDGRRLVLRDIGGKLIMYGTRQPIVIGSMPEKAIARYRMQEGRTSDSASGLAQAKYVVRYPGYWRAGVP